jgi:hypothetical protein
LNREWNEHILCCLSGIRMVLAPDRFLWPQIK